MGNLIGVSRTPPHLSDLLKVHDHLKPPISPNSSSNSSSSSSNNGARSRSGSLVSPKATTNNSNNIANGPPVVELFSSYLFMWRVYVDHKNRLTVQYDPVDLVHFKKFNSNDCYIVLHVINNSELFKQIQNQNNTATTATRSQSVDISQQLHHYHHHHHQILHQHLHSTYSSTTSTSSTTHTSSTSPLDDITLRSFMSSAQSELTPRGLSCPAGVFSCDPISHIETEEISHDVYIWNGKNSDPLTKAFCIAKGFDFVKALKFSDSLPKQRNLDNSYINNDSKYYWKLPNTTSLIIQKLFQNSVDSNNSNINNINNNSIDSSDNNSNINSLSNFGPLSNYFVDDLSPLLDKSKFDGCKENHNQNQQLYNSFHLFKRIIKKNFPQLLNNTQNLPTPISDLIPNNSNSSLNPNNINFSSTITTTSSTSNQQDFSNMATLNNNITVSMANFSESFQKFLDLSQSTNGNNNIIIPNKESLADDNTFPTIPKFNPRYEVLRKLSSNRINSNVTSNNSPNNLNSLINNESIPINGNNSNMSNNSSNNNSLNTNNQTTNPVNIEITTTTTTSNNSCNSPQMKTKTLPFIPKLPINKIKNIPVLDIPNIESPPISGNDSSSDSMSSGGSSSGSLQDSTNNLDTSINCNNSIPKPNPIKRIVPLLNLSKQNSLSSIQIPPQCLNQTTINKIKIPTIVTTSTSTTINTSTSPPQTPRNPPALTQHEIIQLSQREQINYFEPLLNRITDYLFLGSRIPASNLKLLKETGITHIINCAGMVCTNHFPDEFTYKTLYISDGNGEDIWCLFYEIMDFIEDAVHSNGKVYVHCHQGISRSSAFVILYLMWKNDWDFKKAHDYTKEIRYISNPNPGFTGQLLHWKKFSRIGVPKPKLFRMVQLLGNIVIPKAVNTISYLSLDSRCCFILMVQHCIYLWAGEHCIGQSGEVFVEAARRAITRFQKFENASSNIIEIKQGQEDQEFWDLLGGRGGIGFIDAYNKDIQQSISQSTTSSTLTDQSSTTTTTTTTINFINYN